MRLPTRNPHLPCLLGPGRVTWLVLALCLLSLGCVQRRLTIRTNPPGALVYIDDYEIGTTPVSTSFTYYGTRKIRLVKDGYQTVTINHRISAPWYQYFPLDFVSENLVPVDIRDERALDFQLVPQRMVPTELLLERAENLRMNNHPYGIVPAPALPPGSGLVTAPQPTTGVPPAMPSQGAPVHVLPPPRSLQPGTAP